MCPYSKTKITVYQNNKNFSTLVKVEYRSDIFYCIEEKLPKNICTEKFIIDPWENTPNFDSIT